MAKINQPSTQVKLTNVSLVRLKKGKKRFEIACYQNKVQDYRSGVEKDIEEVLQIPQVFTNVSKGQVASQEDIVLCFGKDKTTDEIVLEILKKGEIQLNEKERVASKEKLHTEILTIIATKCINPKSKKRYPPTMINKALTELKVNFLPNRPAKIQALDAIRLLIEKQLIPIARAKMRVKITLELAKYKKNQEQIRGFLADEVDEDISGKLWVCVSYIDPVNYRDIVELSQANNGSVEVLDMTVADESDKNL
ncbi:hypothetical protein BABINDRAFT_47216 [Babjeviella inositovora NRRL Y-12698]|uniref:SBDS family rRNA metabolism protein n=1 Tax=Babjeviella inositovora NRRL Y-12698 TaxID=984486 RepID=A0A1E3QW38_9ASCO|nr:uncharacterized protein BABINDRAFT_47216 [Babjeviella inositovora NRRL Y-12698]ODQ81302.1 hypothetical protein BABINDRAFT_47216 [Babjeviella inositovora NRRL Y-12698]